MIDNSLAAPIRETNIPCPVCQGDGKISLHNTGELLEHISQNQEDFWGVEEIISAFNEWKQSRLINCRHCGGNGYIISQH